MRTAVVDSKESPTAPATCDRSPPRQSPTYRLVIRAHIIPETAVAAAPRRDHYGILKLACIAVALVALTWAGSRSLRHESAGREAAHDASLQPAGSPAQQVMPASPSIGGAASTSASIDDDPAVQQPEPLNASATPVDEIVPTAAVSALQTIHGTIRVAVRVTIDANGKVIAVAAEDPGPSRYFERLSVEAARKWTFTPARQDHRMQLLRFNFTRDGATALAD